MDVFSCSIETDDVYTDVRGACKLFLLMVRNFSHEGSELMPQPRKAGRPSKPAVPGTRVSLGLKVTAQTKARLEEAARISGRTQSQEAEHRLEQSFDKADLLTDALKLAVGGPTAGLVLTIAAAMNMAGNDACITTVSLIDRAKELAAGRLLPEHWMKNPYAYDQAAQAATTVIEALRPIGDRSPPNLNSQELLGSNYAELVLTAVAGFADNPRANEVFDQYLTHMSKVTACQIRSLLEPTVKIPPKTYHEE